MQIPESKISRRNEKYISVILTLPKVLAISLIILKQVVVTLSKRTMSSLCYIEYQSRKVLLSFEEKLIAVHEARFFRHFDRPCFADLSSRLLPANPSIWKTVGRLDPWSNALEAQFPRFVCTNEISWPENHGGKCLGKR